MKKLLSTGSIIGSLIVLALFALLAIGYVKCIYKAVTCNWDPIGKAEVIYTGSVITGLGAIVGWIDIEDK
jgi:hypothetical protein